MKIKKTEKVVKVERTFILELTEDEAEVLKYLTGNVAGSYEGPRGITSKLYDLLEKNGIKNRNDIRVDDIIRFNKV